MFGFRKHEWWGRVKVEMDRETGLPRLKDGWRWEVARRESAGDFWPLEVRLVDRDGGIIGGPRPSMASEKDIRASAIVIMARVISQGLEDSRIESLIGAYPPKELR